MLLTVATIIVAALLSVAAARDRQNINQNWHFQRFETNPDGVIYDRRPDLVNLTNPFVLKPWILPSGNDFILNGSSFSRPNEEPPISIPYVQPTFNDSDWEAVDLPHDWAIKGPFYTGDNPVVGGGMGRLPVQGVGWYRRHISFSADDLNKYIKLEVDGAMSYAMVWLNGKIVGGWPYPYNSFQLDLSPYIVEGDNLLAIRLDNPNDSARWYPGAGLYRNIWLSKLDKVHIGQWGTFVTSRSVSNASAVVDISVDVENSGNISQTVEVQTDFYTLDRRTCVAESLSAMTQLRGGQKSTLYSSIQVTAPSLWSPSSPHRYVAVTSLTQNGHQLDSYETVFGIRAINYTADNGLLINGERFDVKGTDMHHDLGAIGSAFNVHAAERHVKILQEMGSNALRMSHNPPAPELLEITDRMGFIVLDEIFDCWYLNKTTNDFHLIFPDWHEQDLRAMIRRDRNHPSIVAWSYGNEVGEQNTGAAGAAVSRALHDIVHHEDATRLATSAQNAALPGSLFSEVVDILSLNYQGAGIRDTPEYSYLNGSHVPPQYPLYHSTYPNKMIWSSESASSLSSRGTFIFPVTNATSSPVNDTSGGNSTSQQVSDYGLYSADFGASPDKVFLSQDLNSYVAGEFVWTGWDYIGEPTPYYTARSSYSGVIDLAGFKKERYYQYQSRWQPDLKATRILPHWNWPDRVGLVTPVHVFSAADVAELFLNGVSQGQRTKSSLEYRFRWDEIRYEPGVLNVVTFKNGTHWDNVTTSTTGPAAGIRLSADKSVLQNDGYDLGYVTAEVVDTEGRVVPQATNEINFAVQEGGTLKATDNGDPADFTPFPSSSRKAYSGLALAVVSGQKRATGNVTVIATGQGLNAGKITIQLTKS
ncbi:glycoside hydrolase family 2 protein [Myriangium duriaei CBS 260.36]|uniref:Glycoside hydrolase family 2 protein n=1 Tax=Myriangium duriaei CBS 260.36 TaxID=1168546 RepID=A0A9P4J1D4_9PEZI|nr:glycoside hydrolase family 2 protein [Myriangium duriaei CBS 260.36]